MFPPGGEHTWGSCLFSGLFLTRPGGKRPSGLPERDGQYHQGEEDLGWPLLFAAPMTQEICKSTLSTAPNKLKTLLKFHFKHLAYLVERSRCFATHSSLKALNWRTLHTTMGFLWMRFDEFYKVIKFQYIWFYKQWMSWITEACFINSSYCPF